MASRNSSTSHAPHFEATMLKAQASERKVFVHSIEALAISVERLAMKRPGTSNLHGKYPQMEAQRRREIASQSSAQAFELCKQREITRCVDRWLTLV